MIEKVFNLNKIKRKYRIKSQSEIYENINNRSDDIFDYGVYHDLNEIYDWMDRMAIRHDKYVTIIDIGKSFEQRVIRALKISMTNNKSKKRPAIWMDSGIHGREWVTISTLIYVAKELLNNYGIDSEVTDVLNFFDFYILPVFNVDG